ncbi:MAG: hypothetical protein ABI348_11045 [Nitrososphaera sp.]
MSLADDKLVLAYALEVQGEAEAYAALDHFDQKIGQTGDKTETAAKQTEQLKPAYDKAILGFTGAATGAFALYSQYDQLEKIELRVSSAEKNRDAAQKSVIDAQTRLTALTNDGITSGAKYDSAVLGVTTAQQQLAIATEKVNIAQGDLTQSQISFGLSVVPTVTSAVTGFRGAMDALRVAQQAAKVETIIMSPVLAGMTGAMGAATASTGAATGAMGAFRQALNFISTHPIILPLTAIATVLTLVATNAFGVRDALDAFAKKAEEALPILKPVFDFFRTIASAIAPDTQKAFGDMSSSVSTATGAMAASMAQYAADQKTALDASKKDLASFGKSVSDVREEMAKPLQVGDIVFPDTKPPSPPTPSSNPSDFRTIPNPIGDPLQVYDPIMSGFGGQRVSELQKQFKELGEAQAKAGAEMSAKYREVFPELKQYHVELIETMSQNEKASNNLKTTMEDDMNSTRITIQGDIGGISSSYVTLQAQTTKMRQAVESEFASLRASVSSVTNNMVADARRITQAINDIAEASRSLGGTITAPTVSAPSINMPAPAPINIIIQLDGREIARYMGGGNTLKYV